MKAGEEFTCPHCGQNSFLKLVPVLEGWTKKGDALACASCSKIIENVEHVPEEKRESSSSSSADKLKSLLGNVEETKKVVLSASEGEKHFCRDCAHLLVHPFLCRCMKWKKEVDPMGDCPSFARRKTEGKKDAF